MSGNLWFFNIFRGYRNGTLALNWLNLSSKATQVKLKTSFLTWFSKRSKKRQLASRKNGLIHIYFANQFRSSSIVDYSRK